MPALCVYVYVYVSVCVRICAVAVIGGVLSWPLTSPLVHSVTTNTTMGCGDNRHAIHAPLTYYPPMAVVAVPVIAHVHTLTILTGFDWSQMAPAKRYPRRILWLICV